MCDQREQLMDYLYDEMDPSGRRVVEGHLETCRDCRDEMRAFRRVREDLLSWEVPEYSSGYSPFASTPVVPWHRQVPAWALAAAASVMVLLGSAGGYAASMLSNDRPAPMQAATLTAPSPVLAAPDVDRITSVSAEPQTVVMPVGLSNDEIMRLVRSEVARSSTGRVLSVSEAEALVAQAATEQWGRMQGYLTTLAFERELERKNTEQMMGGLRLQVAALQESVALLAAQQSKGQQ